MAVPADIPLSNSAGPWTVDSLLALPEDHSHRVELVDGVILVSPLGTVRHQRLLFRAAKALDSACPPDMEATTGLNVQLSGSRLLIPDFTVNRPGEDGLVLPVEDLVLAGEVLSPSTKFVDLTTKRRLYAEAGVPFYLVVDPAEAEVTATLFELEAGEYTEVARSEGGAIKLPRPFPVTIELSG